MSEYTHKNYHIYKKRIVNWSGEGSAWKYVVISYANDFSPKYFDTLSKAKKWIDDFLMADRVQQENWF
jgi:hypothetical protein